MITEADLAAAWASGYWHGTSHRGPLNDAAVAAKNPHNGQSPLPSEASIPPMFRWVDARTKATDNGADAPSSPTD